MKSFKQFLQERIAAEKNIHLQHLDDLMIIRGRKGLDEITSLLQNIIKYFKNAEGQDLQINPKWDGSPAIISGINPENKKFFVGTKSVFNKLDPKVNYSEKDIDQNHEHPDLRKKLKIALKYLPELNIKSILQGDMLFTRDDLKSKNIDGQDYIIFRPNTITYAIPKNSELAQEILNSKLGIIFHTEYKGNDVTNLKASFKPNLSSLKPSKNVFWRPSDFEIKTKKVEASPEDLKKFEETLNYVKFLNDRLDRSFLDKIELDKELSDLLMSFNNFLIRTNQNDKLPQKKVDDFLQYIKDKYEGQKSTRKTASGQERQEKKEQYISNYFEKNRKNLLYLFQLQNEIKHIKLNIIKQLNRLSSINTFIETEKGKFVPTQPEGFVAVSDEHGIVKLIDRDTFSRFNFILPKKWDSENE